MKDEKQKDYPKCQFFDSCAAYVIREKIADSSRFRELVMEKKTTNPKKWSEQFCFGDFKNCVHYQIRKSDKK